MCTVEDDKTVYNLETCKSCGRNFNVEILDRHFPICQKVKSKPRKILFDESIGMTGKCLITSNPEATNSSHNSVMEETREIKEIALKIESEIPPITEQSLSTVSREAFQRRIQERDVFLSKQLYKRKKLKQKKNKNEDSDTSSSSASSSTNTNYSHDALRTGRSEFRYLGAQQEFVRKPSQSKIPKSTLWKIGRIHLEPIPESRKSSVESNENALHTETAGHSQNQNPLSKNYSSGARQNSFQNLANFCFQCGFKYSVGTAKFCSRCGNLRLSID